LNKTILMSKLKNNRRNPNDFSWKSGFGASE